LTQDPTIQKLLDKIKTQQATEADYQTVIDWLNADPQLEKVEWLHENITGLKATELSAEEPSDKWEQVINRVLDVDKGSRVVAVPTVHRVHFLRRGWIRYAAAIIVILGIGGYLYINNQEEKPSVTTTTNPVPVQNDVAPGGNRATLTLADGGKIILDTAKSGQLAREQNAIITKTVDGKIVYNADEKPGDRILYNTMATPRGGQYQLTLPDGSQVWLNAESSITYPTTFAAAERERRVTITGEAYFEVAKNKAKPFIVTISPAGGGVRRPEPQLSPAGGGVREANGGGLEIEVLGTHFNVNAYKEEATINTTLLEGSVRVSLSALRSPLSNSVHTSLTLKPGQQGQYNPRKENLSLAVHPDVEQVVAWKNGVFNFNGASVEAAMRQMARWYDIEIVYDNEIPQGKFGGEMGRNLTLQQVLKGLEGVSAHFRLEGKKLHVLPLSAK
jgi:transmembrane sensor